MRCEESIEHSFRIQIPRSQDSFPSQPIRDSQIHILVLQGDRKRGTRLNSHFRIKRKMRLHLRHCKVYEGFT